MTRKAKGWAPPEEAPHIKTETDPSSQLGLETTPIVERNFMGWIQIRDIPSKRITCNGSRLPCRAVNRCANTEAQEWAYFARFVVIEVIERIDAEVVTWISRSRDAGGVLRREKCAVFGS